MAIPMTAESTIPPPRTSWWLSPAPPREGLILGIVLALLSCLPVLLATYPQMSDYPAHLARYHVMLERANSPFLQQYYDFEWHWAGNLGVDLLIRPLAALFGLETAGRIIAGTIPVLTGFSILTVGWALRGRIGFASLLAFSFIWQPSLLLGFLNYTLSLALALFAFAGWVKLGQWRWRWALFLPIAPLIWLCHVSGWGVLGILVFGYEWSRNKTWRAFVAPWPLLLPFAMLLLGGGTKGDLQYGPAPLFFKQVLWIRGMRDQVEWLDIASMGLVGLVFLLVLGFQRIDSRIGWASIIMVIGSLAMPRHIFGGDYADYRLISAGLLAGCLSIAWRAPRLVLLLPVALFLTRLGVTSETWWRNSRETGVLLTALDHVPQGARVASLVTVGLGDWHFDTFEHVGGYATIRRDALSNMHFALPKVHMLAIRPGVVPDGVRFTDPSQRLFVPKGHPVDLAHFKPAAAADYLWFIGDDPAGALPAGATVIWHHRHALLARLAKPRRGS
jgi:hypothetical protein